MSWYYAEAGQQKGPVTDAEFDGLIQSGTIRPDTLVWREGMAAWQKLSAVRPVAGGVPPLVAPAAGGSASSGTVPESVVRGREYAHDLGDYFSRSWDVFKSDPWVMIGATLAVYACVFAANAIPYLGAVLGIIFTGPLMGGMFLFLLRKIRGQSASVGDAFSGFGPRFGQLLLGHFIPALLAGISMLPVVVMIFVGLFAFGVFGRHSSPPNWAVMVPVLVVGGVLALIGLCVMIYLQTCWLFTLWLVADKNMSFWPAMSLSRCVVRKHWWMTFLMTLAAGAISVAGMILCGVGLLVAGPVAIGMFAFAYERLFGDLQPAAG